MDQNHTKDQLSKPPTKNDATRRRFFGRISPRLVSQGFQLPSQPRSCARGLVAGCAPHGHPKFFLRRSLVVRARLSQPSSKHFSTVNLFERSNHHQHHEVHCCGIFNYFSGSTSVDTGKIRHIFNHQTTNR